MTKTRIEWVDAAKGIGIILVMLGHCYLDEKYTFWFYAFHMPLFFFLSGFTFSRDKRYLTFLLKKIKTLLVPYIFFAAATMLCNGVLAVTHGNSYNIFEITKLYLIQKRYTLLWFISCLFLTEQLMYLCQWIVRNISFKYLGLILSVMSFATFYFYKAYIGCDLPWNADLVPLALSFMSLGKWIHDINLLEKISSGSLYVSLACSSILCLVTSWCNYTYFVYVDWYYNKFGNPVLFLIAALSGVLATLLISMSIHSKGLTSLGRDSLLFYGLHRLVIDNIYVIFIKLGIDYASANVTSLMVALVNVLCTVAILGPVNLLIKKNAPWCLGKFRNKANK